VTARLVPAQGGVTLGILAGGQASRLGGLDKAWLVRDGIAQVVRLADALAPQVEAVVVSANRNAERFLAHGLRALHDRSLGLGPLGGLDVLADACRTPWLLTLPVDVVEVPPDLVERLLVSPGSQGVSAHDDEGPQPLVALWPVAGLREALPAAIASGDLAVRSLQARLGMGVLRMEGIRLGNLNTGADLAAAGIAPP
jgi:molybdenum cofactor guanylyltransferase